MNWHGVESKEEGFAPPLKVVRTVKLSGHVALSVAEREERGNVKRMVKRMKMFIWLM